MSTKTALKLKFGLIAFGLLLGLLVSHFALRFLKASKAGSEFENLEDLRASVINGKEGSSEKGLNLRDLLNPHPNDRVIFDLRPNLNVTFQEVPVRTNSCGMRGGELSIVKPAGTYRIALLGDSFAFGWGVKEEESFAAVLEQELNRLSGGQPRFEVLNFGVPGYSTFQQVALFKEKGLEFSPDSILVYFVANDFGFPFFVRDISKGGDGLLTHVELINLARNAFQPARDEQRLIEVGLDPNRALQELAAIASQKGMDLKIALNPTKVPGELVKKLWVLKSRKDIDRIKLSADLKRLTSARGLTPAQLRLPSDPHPNALKHRLLGLIMVPYYMNDI